MCEELQNKVDALQEENARLKGEVHALREALHREGEALATGEIRLKLAYLSTIQALVRAIEARDPYTVGHSTMVSILAVTLARKLGLSEDECERVRIAGTLLDVGKIGIAGDLLTKREDLSDKDLLAMREHVHIGAQIDEPIIYPWDVSTLIFQHHERLDGSGYPEGLANGEIQREAMILGLADSFVAMIVRRAYREAHKEAEVVAFFRNEAGKTYDKESVDALVELLHTDPDLRREIDRFKLTID